MVAGGIVALRAAMASRDRRCVTLCRWRTSRPN